MNILLLSNWTPGYHNFFNHLAKKLTNEGHTVVVAVDSHFSRFENNLHRFNFKTYEFSSFFKNSNINKSILSKYSQFNLNSALLSDYERAEVYGILPKNRIDYYERLKSALLSFYEKIFNENNIDVVLYENVSNTFAHFAFFASKRNNIKYVGLGMSRLPNRFFVSSDPLADGKQIETIFKKIRTGEIAPTSEVREWSETYLDNIENIVPDYMKTNNLDQLGLIKKYVSNEKIRRLFRTIKFSAADHTHSFQVGNPFVHTMHAVKRNILRRIRVNFIKKYYYEPQNNDNFLLYPLHYHPEASTSILSGAYLNEYEVIRNIAFNLPQGLSLYVKDHMSAYGHPNISFYRRISALPGVKIIKPSANTKDLIKRAQAIVTLTSTVGYEALLLNKPVYLFGNVFYAFHSNVIKIDDPTKIFDIINTTPHPVDRQYNIDFISSYYLSTNPGLLNFLADHQTSVALVEKNYPTLKKILLEPSPEWE